MSYSNYNRNYTRRRSGKIKWKKIILTVLGVVLALALISGIVSFFKDDTKTVHPVWALGDATNELYSLADNSIYTKEMFPCKGLAIELDYGFECMYTVSYYDKDGEYLGRDLYMDQEEVSAVADVPENAFFARITLEPALLGEVNSNGDSIPGKIEWHEIATYGSKLKITVDREQPDIDRAEEHFLPLSERKIDLHNVNLNEGMQFGMVTYTSAVNKMLENKTITQIGFPILFCDTTSITSTLIAYKVDAFDYSVIETYAFTIPANTLTSAVFEYYYFDCNITLEEGEALAFEFEKDNLGLGYYDGNDLTHPGAMIQCDLSTPEYDRNICLLFDIVYK